MNNILNHFGLKCFLFSWGNSKNILVKCHFSFLRFCYTMSTYNILSNISCSKKIIALIPSIITIYKLSPINAREKRSRKKEIQKKRDPEKRDFSQADFLTITLHFHCFTKKQTVYTIKGTLKLCYCYSTKYIWKSVFKADQKPVHHVCCYIYSNTKTD